MMHRTIFILRIFMMGKSAEIEEMVRKDFNEFMNEAGGSLHKVDEQTRLFLAFISGAQAGSKYAYSVEMDAIKNHMAKKDEQD